MKKTLFKIFALCALAAAFSACYRMDDIYQQYVVDGGHVYPAKPVNLTYVKGYKRVILKWDRPYDPAVKTAKVFWENYTDSMFVDYADFPNGKVEVSIPDLAERSYTFDVKDYDSKGNISLASEITASPYGDFWLSALSERRVKQARMFTDTARIVMSPATDQMVATEFSYKNALNETVVVKDYLLPGTDTLYFPAALKGAKFEFRSCYCPVNGADTVWTKWTKSTSAIDYKLNTSDWTVTTTTGQVQGTYTANKIFDGITDAASSRWHSSQNTSIRRNFPKMLAIDTHTTEGNEICMSSFAFYEHPTAQNSRYIKSYRIYAGNEPFDPDEANYASIWGDFLAEGTLDRLSPLQEGTALSEQFARYFVIVFLDSYQTYGYIDLWEFEPYGYLASEAI